MTTRLVNTEVICQQNQQCSASCKCAKTEQANTNIRVTVLFHWKSVMNEAPPESGRMYFINHKLFLKV